jgi:hypothetical protein
MRQLKKVLITSAVVCGIILLLSRQVTWSLHPPDNLPVLACEKSMLMYSPVALSYDLRDFWVHDPASLALVNVKTEEELKSEPDWERVLVLRRYGDCRKEKLKPDLKHRDFFDQRENLFSMILRWLGLRNQPWTADGQWRELMRDQPL